MATKFTLQKIDEPAGICWHCGGRGSYILDDSVDEIFVCLPCIEKHYKNTKLLKKVRKIRKAEKINNSKFSPLRRRKESKSGGLRE